MTATSASETVAGKDSVVALLLITLQHFRGLCDRIAPGGNIVNAASLLEASYVNANLSRNVAEDFSEDRQVICPPTPCGYNEGAW